jgi:hypothetical protein
MVSQAVSPRPKLPVLQTVRDAYLAVITNFAQLLRISWVWALSLALSQAIVIWHSETWLAEAPLFRGSTLPTRAVAASATLLPFYLLAAASVAVAWHRLLLRSERSLSRMYFRLDRLVWRYLALALIISIPFLVLLTLGYLVVVFGVALVAPSRPFRRTRSTD